MAIYTQLSVTAIPGGRRSHLARGASRRVSNPFTRLSVLAVPGPPWIVHEPDQVRGDDLFTKLSVQAVPGPRWIIHRPDQTRGTDLFTKLSTIAVPGPRLSFEAKLVEDLGGRGPGWLSWEAERQREYLEFLKRQDREFEELLEILLKLGVL